MVSKMELVFVQLVILRIASILRAVSLNWRQFFPPSGVWQCLGTYLVVTAMSEIGTGIKHVEARDNAK